MKHYNYYYSKKHEEYLISRSLAMGHVYVINYVNGNRFTEVVESESLPTQNKYDDLILIHEGDQVNIKVVSVNDFERQFKIETGKKSRCKETSDGNLTGKYSNDYVQWLDSKLKV